MRGFRRAAALILILGFAPELLAALHGAHLLAWRLLRLEAFDLLVGSCLRFLLAVALFYLAWRGLTAGRRRHPRAETRSQTPHGGDSGATEF